MSIQRGTYTDNRYRQPVTFTVVDSGEPYLGAIYVAPADRPDAACELSGPYFTRCTRGDLREWAQAILTALDETPPITCRSPRRAASTDRGLQPTRSIP